MGVVLVVVLAVGPAVNAANRLSRATCAVERGANFSYETLDTDEDESAMVLAPGGRTRTPALVEAMFVEDY